MVSLDLGCTRGTPVAGSACAPGPIAPHAAPLLAKAPTAPPGASQQPGSPSPDNWRTCESVHSCAGGGSDVYAPRPRSQRCSRPGNSGRRLSAQQLRAMDVNSGSRAGQRAESWAADGGGPPDCAHVLRPADSSPAGDSGRRLPLDEVLQQRRAGSELPVKRRAVSCAVTSPSEHAPRPYEYAPRPRSAHCGPAGGSGRRLYARAQEQSRRNEIRCAMHPCTDPGNTTTRAALQGAVM